MEMPCGVGQGRVHGHLAGGIQSYTGRYATSRFVSTAKEKKTQ